MHSAARLQFERVAREFAQWRAVPENERSPAPAWWWQPLLSTYAAAAAMLLGTLADQTSLSWPEEFSRRIHRNDEQ